MLVLVLLQQKKGSNHDNEMIVKLIKKHENQVASILRIEERKKAFTCSILDYNKVYAYLPTVPGTSGTNPDLLSRNVHP